MMAFDRPVRLLNGFRSRDEPWRYRTLIVDAYHLLSATANLIPCFLCSSIKQHSKQSRFGRRRGRKLSDGCKLQALGRGTNGDQWELPNSNRSRKESGRQRLQKED